MPIGNGLNSTTWPGIILKPIGQTIGAWLSRLVTVLAAASVIESELEKNDRCVARLEREQRFCGQKYGKNNPTAYGQCKDRAFWRFNNCLRGLPDPGPLDPADPNWSTH